MKRADQAIHNYLLIEERKQRNWSQRDVADRIGTTTINVCRWERGITSPSSHFRKLLCELFGRSSEDLGLFPPSTFVAEKTRAGLPGRDTISEIPLSRQTPVSSSEGTEHSPFYWHMPHQRNVFFTGREEILARLANMLDLHQYTAQTLPPALSGPAGIGKTQVAVEYAYRYSGRYRAVLWANAETREALLADFAAIASTLHLPQTEGSDRFGAARHVMHWLREHTEWLLILDNVTDLPMVSNFLPSSPGGAVLLITRRRAMGPFARCIELNAMPPSEGALFLLRRAKLVSEHSSLEAACEKQTALALKIEQLMDGFPLALDQAGAYIDESILGVADYLAHYQLHRLTLLNRRGAVVIGHPSSMYKTYVHIMEELEQVCPTAADLARICAFLAPAAIPEELIRHGLRSRTKQEITAADVFSWDEAINELYCRSLLRYHAETRAFALYPLVQTIWREHMDEQGQRDWVERVLHIVSRCFAEANEREEWELCQRCLPHVHICTAFIERWSIASADATHLLQQMRRYTRQHFIPDQSLIYAQRSHS